MLGAKQLVTETIASEFFPGEVKEFVLYDTKLDAVTLSRLEDYQLSRWQDVLLWDYRSETTALTLAGKSDARNSLNGGWGKDQLTGGNLDDILRGGPSDDVFTGGPGVDRFQIFPGDGNDTVTDFTEEDILDLSPFYEGQSGSPSDYLTLTSQIDYQAGQAPVVNTLVTTSIGEKVTLQGIALKNEDLPRLVGNGTFYLGGPRFESALALATADRNLTETEFARPLTLTRTGSLDASVDVYLSFVGSAANKADYSVANALENGVVHKVTFPADVSEVSVDITPIQDTLPESEEIEIAILPSSAFPAGGGAMTFTLDDAPQVTIEAIVQHAQRLGSVPGVIQVSRDGDVAKALDVRLSFDGTAQNGEDFSQVAPVVSFAPNEQTKLINITPAAQALDKSQVKVATVSVVPDVTQFATMSPWSASVMILDKLNGAVKSYDSWRASLDPAFNVEGALAGDFDFIPLYSEYVHGLDPTVANNSSELAVNVFTLDGRLIMEVPSHAGLGDVRLYPQGLVSSSWQDVSDLFAHSLYSLSDDRLMHVFTSRQAVTEFDTSGIYRLKFDPTTSPGLATDVGALLGTAQQPYLVTGTSTGWVPASDGSGLGASARDAGEVSDLLTSVTGATALNFDWQVAADSGASLSFLVDGVVVATLDAGEAATTVNHQITGEGTHQLKWQVNYGGASDAGLQEFAKVSNVSIGE